MAVSKFPDDSKRKSDSVVGQLAYDIVQNKIMTDLINDPSIRQIEASIDPVEFLDRFIYHTD